MKTDEELIIQGLKAENLALNSEATEIITNLYHDKKPLHQHILIETLYNILKEYRENNRRIDD